MTGPLLYARTPEGLLFRSAATSEKSDTVIELSARDQTVSVVGLEEFPLQGKITKVAALLGFIKLKLNRYVVIANRVEESGRLDRHTFYKVVDHSYYSCKENALGRLR